VLINELEREQRIL
jgi:hypothetical protein